MLKVKTTRFGEIEVQDADIITLPEGLIGFPELKRFVLLDHAKDGPLKWFQSLDDGQIAFVLLAPLLLAPDYIAEATEKELEPIGRPDEQDVRLAVILTIGASKMTANMLAPLVFNTKTMKGKQLVLHGSKWTTRHPFKAEDLKRA